MAEHKTLAEALAAFQAELPKVRKGETAKVTGESRNGGKVNYSYDYAGLDTVVESVLPYLGRHGLSVTSRSTMADSGFMLEVSLLHEAGERETGYWPLPDPRRVGPQDLGSAYTYGRRYLTLALTGTFPGGEDDDGKQAQASARDSWEDAKPRQMAQARPAEDRQAAAGQEPQAAPAPPAPKTSWTDDEVAAYLAKIPIAPLPNTIQAYDWMASKKLHNRAVAIDGQTWTATALVAARLGEEALKPTASTAQIADLRNTAADRGLLKLKVDGDDTLEKVLHEARDLAAHEAAEDGGQPSGPIESDADIRQGSPGSAVSEND